MAAKRHMRPVLLVLMALVLVFPPLTSVMADSLGKLANDVPQANRLRYTSSANQPRTLSDRLHMRHEQGNAAAAQQMAPQLNGVVRLLQLNGVVRLLMVRAEAN
jgi:hypothetical protein